MKTYQAGIDVGSTTVKLVVLDENGQMIFGQYQRHLSHTQRALSDLLKQARAALGECALELRATGSGAINLAKALGIPFVQEVVAVAQALERVAPQVDVAIELGGEDAKIIYFKGGLEERMNGVCAGGTGSFIDQMAALLQTDASGLDREAAHYQQIYPIAARLDLPGGRQPDHFGPCLRQAHPRPCRVLRWAAALPPPTQGRVYPHAEADG